jgi:hypothetical protein
VLQRNCDALAEPTLDQYLVCFTAEHGSRSAEALRLLSVVGTQDMTVAGEQ